MATAVLASSLIGRSNMENSLERSLEGGLIVICDGVVKQGNNIFVEYTVLSEEDLVVKVGEIGHLFDDKGGRIAPVATSPSTAFVEIGGDVLREREIIGGVRTKIRIRYNVPANYELAEKYARVTININGKQLTFRDIPGKK